MLRSIGKKNISPTFDYQTNEAMAKVAKKDEMELLSQKEYVGLLKVLFSSKTNVSTICDHISENVTNQAGQFKDKNQCM